MKLLKINKNEMKIGPAKFGSNVSLAKYVLLLLILWLPIKEWPTVSNIFGNVAGIVAPLLVLIMICAIAAQKGFNVRFGKIEKIFAVFLGLTLISAGLSVAVYGQPSSVVRDTSVIFELFFLYLVGVNLEKNDLNFAVKFGIFEATLIALFGIWQFWSKAPINELWIVPGEVLRSRAFATFLSPNGLASYLLVWFWLSVWFGAEEKKIWFLASAPILLSMYFTYSRNILLSLGIGVLVLVIINRKRINRNYVYGIIAGFVITAIFFAKRIANLFNSTYIYYTEEAGRTWAARNVLHILPNHLFFGVGPGMYGGQTAAEVPSPVYLESIQHGYAATYLTDSQYLQTLIQQGILGLLAYLYLFWELTKRLYERAKKYSIFGGVVLAIWLGYSVQGLFENIWFVQATATIVWIIIGVGLREKT